MGVGQHALPEAMLSRHPAKSAVDLCLGQLAVATPVPDLFGKDRPAGHGITGSFPWRWERLGLVDRKFNPKQKQ